MGEGRVRDTVLTPMGWLRMEKGGTCCSRAAGGTLPPNRGVKRALLKEAGAKGGRKSSRSLKRGQTKSCKKGEELVGR